MRQVKQGSQSLHDWARKAQDIGTVSTTLEHSTRTCPTLLRSTLYAAALVAVSLSAQAAWPPALPAATLSFSTPSGTVGPTDAIEIWPDFKVPAGGPALVFNADAFLVAPDVPTLGTYFDINGQAQETAFTSYSYASFGS